MRHPYPHFATTRVFDWGNSLGTEIEGGVPVRLKTSNGPVKSSCVIPGKITKPMLNSDMPLSAKDWKRRLGDGENIALREDIRNGTDLDSYGCFRLAPETAKADQSPLNRRGDLAFPGLQSCHASPALRS